MVRLGQEHRDGYWRNRRSRRLLAVPAACSALGTDHMGSTDWRLREGTRKTCLKLVVVVVVSDSTVREQCLFSTPSYELCKGALGGKELFAIEGSKNWRSTPGQPGEARKMRKNRRKPPSPPP